MNLILLEKFDFIDDDLVQIQGRRLDHLKTVTKVKAGDTLVCGQLNGKMGTGIVCQIADDHCRIKVTLDSDPPLPLPLTLVLALPRPKYTRRIIQAATSLGVKQIYLINSWRVEKSFWKSPVISPDSLHQQMILGLEQSRDTMLPVVHFKRFFRQFVEQDLPEISKNSVCITAHPKTDRLCPMAIDQPVTLIVGPEGGFIDIEIQTLEKYGFNSYHIGSRILKVETAVPYLISRLYS
ncbi:MAG: 16S rRNA (uracil(1498)-N(3))-methyltransferase [Pseudomonadota bacterium]